MPNQINLYFQNPTAGLYICFTVTGQYLKATAAKETTEDNFAGPMPFTSLIGNLSSDTAFLEQLKKETSADTRKAAPKQAAKAELTEGQIRKLKLKESDVAKVTREGISHLQFHPTSSDLVIATGDKQGHIALWDVDKKTKHEVLHPSPPACPAACPVGNHEGQAVDNVSLCTGGCCSAIRRGSALVTANIASTSFGHLHSRDAA